MNPPSNIQYSIIIPAYNAATTITACLSALQQQTIPADQYEIIVIDDGSQDNTSNLVEATGAVLHRQANQGQAAARNVGIQMARGHIICFTDSDCIPFPNWLEAITQPLRDDETIMGCKGIYQTQQTAVTARFVQLEYEDKYDKLKQYPFITFVDTYSAAYRRHILIACGGFDERFPVAEDRELSYRIAAQGHKMLFQPTATVYHIHADTIWSYFRKKVQNGYWAGQAIGHFPERQREDSYTPQTMKLQVGLIALILLTLPLALFSRLGQIAYLILKGAFLTTAVSFIRKAWAKDKVVAIASPFYLALRALALGIGYSWRILKPIQRLKR